MISKNRSSGTRKTTRLLAVAGIGLCMLIPFSARAHYRDNDAVDILVGTAVAYALIDAAGGFDEHRHHRHRYHHPRRAHHARHGKYERSWRHHRRHGFHREHRGYREHRRHRDHGYRYKNRRHHRH